MALLFDDTVSDAGEASFTATRVNYWFYHSFELGPMVQEVAVRDSDFLRRIGWVTLGTEIDVPDLGSLPFWREPIYLNFYNTLWSSVPQTDVAANDFGVWATRIRWSLSPGSVGRLVVFGV